MWPACGFKQPFKGSLAAGCVGGAEKRFCCQPQLKPSDLSIFLSLFSTNKYFPLLCGKSVLHNIAHTELEWESEKMPREATMS